MIRNDFVKNLTLVLITALFAFLGAIFGYYYLTYREREAWLIEKKYEASLDLIKIRSDLLERANIILYKTEVFRTLTMEHKRLLDLMKLPITNEEDIDFAEKKFAEMVSTNIELNKLFAEFATVMRLCAINFGTKTKSAVKELIKEDIWWEKDPAKVHAVIKAMEEEFLYGIVEDGAKKNERESNSLFRSLQTRNLSGMLTILLFLVNVVALVVVAYQTFLTRKSLDTARQTIVDARRTRQLELLPRATFLIKVRLCLQKWHDDLCTIIDKLNIAISKKDGDILKEIAYQSLKTPRGLINRYIYEHAPNWLSVVLTTGAQYYYDCKAPMRSLWDDNDKKPNFTLAVTLLDRTKECDFNISQLVTYIDEFVPELYLNSPASLNDEDFLTGH